MLKEHFWHRLFDGLNVNDYHDVPFDDYDHAEALRKKAYTSHKKYYTRHHPDYEVDLRIRFISKVLRITRIA